MKTTVQLTEAQTRKVLAERIATVLDAEVKYSGTGSVNGYRFAYQIGPVTLTKENELVGYETLSIEKLNALGEMADFYGYEIITGWDPVNRWVDIGNGMVTLEEGITLTREAAEALRTEGQVTINIETGAVRDSGTGTIAMPWMEPDEFQKLEAIVASKHDLICKAIGKDPSEALYIKHNGEGEQIEFPWFTTDQIACNGIEYAQFIYALCNLAGSVRRVTAKQRPVPNDKYAFRCFLLRLGFIGEKYAKARKLLLANLTGNGAFRQPKGGEADD